MVASSPVSLVDCIPPPPGCFDSRPATSATASPAYVRLPPGLGVTAGRHVSLASAPHDLPLPEHSPLLCEFMARESERLAREKRLLLLAVAQGGPPGLLSPCARKVSTGDDSTCAGSTATRSPAISDAASEEEMVILSEASSDDGNSAVVPTPRQHPRKALPTVVVRNLPLCYTRADVIDLLERHGLRLSCDFLYLPIDFNTGDSLGYAFLNFVTAGAAKHCYQRVNGKSAGAQASGEEEVGGAGFEVAWTSAQQGLSAHIRRYRSSPVMHVSVPDEYKPVLFANGERIPFPAPRRDIRCPRDQVERTRTGAISKSGA